MVDGLLEPPHQKADFYWLLAHKNCPELLKLGDGEAFVLRAQHIQEQVQQHKLYLHAFLVAELALEDVIQNLVLRHLAELGRVRFDLLLAERLEPDRIIDNHLHQILLRRNLLVQNRVHVFAVLHLLHQVFAHEIALVLGALRAFDQLQAHTHYVEQAIDVAADVGKQLAEVDGAQISSLFR